MKAPSGRRQAAPWPSGAQRSPVKSWTAKDAITCRGGRRSKLRRSRLLDAHGDRHHQKAAEVISEVGRLRRHSKAQNAQRRRFARARRADKREVGRTTAAFQGSQLASTNAVISIARIGLNVEAGAKDAASVRQELPERPPYGSDAFWRGSNAARSWLDRPASTRY